MTTKKLAFVCIRLLSLLCLFMAIANIGQALQWGIYVNFNANNILGALTPAILFTVMFILFWFYAGTIARKLTRHEDVEFEIHVPGLFPMTIALIGIFLLALDVSSLFMVAAEYAGDAFEEESDFGDFVSTLTEAAATIVSMLIDLFLIFKSGWIASKISRIWNKV